MAGGVGVSSASHPVTIEAPCPPTSVLDALPLPTAKAIEIVAFVPAASIDPIQIGASYYLAAEV